MFEGDWVYPSDIVQPQQMDCEFIYNLVVDQGHVAIVNQTPLILLGHNYTQGILKHPYLGTQKVIDDLEKMPGYKQGLVLLNDGCMLKSKKTGQQKLIYNGP